MTRRLVKLTVDEPTFSLRGYKAHALALAAGLRPTYNGIAGAWVADTKKLPQFTAYLEYRNVAYSVSSPGQVVPGAPPVSTDTPEATAKPGTTQLDLFDGSR